ncbi:hypothetical protein SASPL_124033 [Salvia splendens]|uniref:Uncharacterized protein n=1 Tax=Salvia splendens TaxID=180675 RepID=A0A8X8XR00_SALSN|nr:hypothetical protein SASPL_124033 [Salvia splendens]
MASFYAPLPHAYNYNLNFSGKPLIFSAYPKRLFSSCSRTKLIASSSSPNDASSAPGDSAASFCIIEGPETVQDFVQMQLQEIQDNIKSRRNKIFLLMEELRRLRVQQRIKSMEWEPDDENEMPDIPSSIPFLPHLTPKTLKQLYLTSFSFISGIIVFGGLIAPTVDPIVASFSGGAVGVISALMLLEINNVEQQEKKRCKYCHGTGYLSCARCSASGLCVSIEPIVTSATDRPLNAPTTRRCQNCSGSGKVMCPTCLCTGMIMASEHDPRIEPFD